ncbi:MAG: MBOAT family protein [Lachnospiraceae bacterium]|nr:MBOAT family protein [Lachnospiraceae bacterium]
MTFASIKFLCCFAGFLIIYFLTPNKYKRYLLLIGSVAFIAVNSIKGAIIAAAFVPINYFLARKAYNEYDPIISARRSAALNLIVLCIFKVTGFLPVGASFYIFTYVAYLIDVGRHDIKYEKNFIDYANYALFFPRILMGPIARYKDARTQIKSPVLLAENVQHGLESFILGFSMKIILADRLIHLQREVDRIGIDCVSTSMAWLTALTFALRLYLDWQSYCLMASGVAKILGFDLPINFNYPHMAKSVSEFYRRWHMTLTSWFKDYIYIPMGGSRKGKLRTIFNILFIWLLTGLWHGLTINFVFWGLALGVFVVLEHLGLKKLLDKLHVLPHIYVIFVITATFAFFATTGLNNIALYFEKLFPIHGLTESMMPGDTLIYLKKFGPYLLGGVLCALPYPERIVHRFGRKWYGAIVLSAIFWATVYVLWKNGNSPFMYMNF